MPMLKSTQQEAFCKYMAEVFEANATAQMKQRAAYKCTIKAGYSESSARTQASRLLKKVNILKRIDEIKQENAKKAGIDVEQRRRELLDTLQRIRNNPEEKTPNILKSIEIECKMLGLFTERREFSSAGSSLQLLIQPIYGAPENDDDGEAEEGIADGEED